MLVKSALVMLERYAERAALDPNILGVAVQYSVGALYITDGMMDGSHGIVP